MKKFFLIIQYFNFNTLTLISLNNQSNKYFQDFKLHLKYFKLLTYVINTEVSYKIIIKINV